MSFSPNLSIYPAHAGINHLDKPGFTYPINLPRTRGDKPDNGIELIISNPSTPHTRG